MFNNNDDNNVNKNNYINNDNKYGNNCNNISYD